MGIMSVGMNVSAFPQFLVCLTGSNTAPQIHVHPGQKETSYGNRSLMNDIKITPNPMLVLGERTGRSETQRHGGMGVGAEGGEPW